MNLPNNLKEKLGYNIIHARLKSYCASELGENKVENLKFSNNLSEVQSWINQANEFRQIIDEGKAPPLAGISNITPILERVAVKGNWISADELYKLYKNLSVSRLVSDFILENTKAGSSLNHLRVRFDELKKIELKLEKSIDEEGKVLDGASSDLKAIRRKIQAEEGVLRKKVNSIYRQAKSDGIIPEGATISVRDGRMVIPVLASNKRQIQGFVHDESASGNIVFLEPTVILEANNTIRELQIAESREIHRILLELSDLIRQNLDTIDATTSFLSEVDFLWAKAKLARVLDATKPELTKATTDIRQLKHPLLLFAAIEDNRKVVPHSLILDDNNKIILISGPNAGGKSVAMKSLGLNQLLVQSGLLPCCDPDSKFRIFNKIFVDIGDEQSIDNDLSTYSSHLKNMVLMIKKADADSLILIDEFGSGTDPTFGGAIAESVLDKLCKQQVTGLITTHFSNLKLFADRTNGVQNAAMLFDLKKLKPLYELEVGRPGSSFSLEVASKSGIPKDVIKLAESGVGANQIDIEKLLGRLEDEKRRFQLQNQKLSEKDTQLNQLKNEYKILKKKLEDRQKDIINLAKQEASQILAKTNREIEKTIRHIKENKAEKKETKRVRQTLENFAGKVKPDQVITKPHDIKLEEGVPVKGDQALIKEKNVIVQVQEVKGKKAKVLIGELSSVVNVNSLVKVSNREAKKIQKSLGKTSVSNTVNDLMTDYSPILDVRGTRASELLNRFQKFLDDSVMLNQQSVKVIHGKGNGVLRELVRNELKQWSQVERFENEHAERGGDGATLIYFR